MLNPQFKKESLHTTDIKAKHKAVSVPDVKKIKSQECWFREDTNEKIPNPASFISFIGSNRLVDPEYGNVGKFLWLIIIFTCYIASNWLVVTQLCIYWECPITTTVALNREFELDFPSVKICPNFVHTFLYSRELQGEKGKTFTNELYEKLSAGSRNPKEIFNKLLGFKEEGVQVYFPCDNQSEGCNIKFGRQISVSNESVPTFWGNCLVLSSENKILFRGPFSFMRIVVNISRALEPFPHVEEMLKEFNISNEEIKLGILYQIHPKGSKSRKHEIFYYAEKALAGTKINLQLTYKQFISLNTTKNPCYKEEDISTCLNDCLDEIIFKEIKCKLYYMNSNSKSLCTFSKSPLEQFQKIANIYNTLNCAKCQCREPCNAISYTTTRWFEKHTQPDLIELKLFYWENTFTLTKQEYQYDFDSLLADIGGLWGFFLGFSLLTGVEFFEFLIHFCHYCRRNFF